MQPTNIEQPKNQLEVDAELLAKAAQVFEFQELEVRTEFDGIGIRWVHPF